MKYILYCNLPYAFSILKPLEDEIIKREFDCIWYVPKNILEQFPYQNSSFTSDIKDIREYKSDVIFVAGNEVPHFLRGIKVQIFHGLAGEKKGHFRIRDYFDLYLTQGEYFTTIFNTLALKHKNFKVIETGWCKLDNLYKITNQTIEFKKSFIQKYGVQNIILYSPTFSPSLTSGDKLLDVIKELSKNKNILVIIKFHDKMDKLIIKKYQNILSKNLIISKDKDITRLLQIADLMISDTSSVVYEFTLLDKPVITLDSKSKNISWLNLKTTNNFTQKVLDILNGLDKFKIQREYIIKHYHPYNDGKSSSRMIDATIEYKNLYGIPNKRNLSILRKFKIYKNMINSKLWP